MLLLLRDLLDAAIDFMGIPARYGEATDLVIKFIDHKEKQVRTWILALIPRLAQVKPDSFVSSSMSQFMSHCCFRSKTEFVTCNQLALIL